jgi:hypothetical protein
MLTMMKPILKLLFLWLTASSAHAIAPGYETDGDLAHYPYIVLAQWDKAAMRPHELIRGNVLEKFECFTELNILRVIKGDIKPGRHGLIFGFGIGWQEDGTGLSSGTSTEIPGDVDNVRQPNIWFLNRSRSWDATDRTEYLQVPHYRAIQPASLETYFIALSSARPEQLVPGLLSSDNPEIVRRVLNYICGEILPWPYEPAGWDRYSHPTKRERLLKDQASSLRKYLSGYMREHRHLAAAVYAELSGKDGVEFIRTLLADRDPKVRAVAIGILIRNKDEETLPKLGAAIEGLQDTHLACSIAREAALWGDVRLVPLLIPLLEDDSDGGRIGKDVRVPALKARDALHDITGCWFPFGIAQSRQSWIEVASLGNQKDMRRQLREVVPFKQCPLQAEFYGSLSDSHIRVVNASTHPVRICRYPAWVDANTPNMVANAGTDYREEDKKERDFLTLDAGGATVFRIHFADHFNGVDPKDLSLSLFYRDLPTGIEKTGWIGWVDVRRMEGQLEETGKAQQGIPPNDR